MCVCVCLCVFGLEGNIFNFIRDFLRNRKIQVRVGSELSSVRTLANGTPQGSVISPLLFLLMVKDITESDRFDSDTGLGE